MGCAASTDRAAPPDVSLPLLGEDEWAVISSMDPELCITLCSVSRTMCAAAKRCPRVQLAHLVEPAASRSSHVDGTGIRLLLRFELLRTLALVEALDTRSLVELSRTVPQLGALQHLDVSHNGLGDSDIISARQVHT